MPMNPAITPVGKRRTEAIVKVCIASFARWAVRDM